MVLCLTREFNLPEEISELLFTWDCSEFKMLGTDVINKELKVNIVSQIEPSRNPQLWKSKKCAVLSYPSEIFHQYMHTRKSKIITGISWWYCRSLLRTGRSWYDIGDIFYLINILWHPVKNVLAPPIFQRHIYHYESTYLQEKSPDVIKVLTSLLLGDAVSRSRNIPGSE